MKALKIFGTCLLLLFAIPIAIVMRFFGWRPKREPQIQSLFHSESVGWAIVNEQEKDKEPYPYVYVEEDGNARELRGPKKIRVNPVVPEETASPRERQIAFMRQHGFEITENENGSFTATPSKMFSTKF